MNNIIYDPSNGLEYIDVGGHRRYLASKPDVGGKFKALPKFTDHFTVLDKKDWFEVDRRAMFAVLGTFDQNGYGSCVGNGWAMGLSKARMLAGMSSVLLSPAWWYSLINDNSDNGAIISDGIEAGINIGTCKFSTVGQDPIYQSRMPSGAKAEAARFKIAKAYQVTSYADIITALLMPKPMIPVYGYQVGNNFERFDQYGVAGHDRGPGNHCLTPETIVSGTGMKEAKDISIGDIVYGHDGELHEVNKVFERYYNGSIVNIIGAGGIKISVTEEHPILIYRWTPVKEMAVVNELHGSPEIEDANIDGASYKAVWMQAKDIRQGDYLVTPKIVVGNVDDDALDFFIGYYCGNGSLIYEKNRGFKGVHIDLPIDGPIEEVESVLSRYGKVTRIWRGTSGKLVSQEEATSLRLRLSNKLFAEKINEEVGRYSHTKKFPRMSQAVLRGYLAADGHENNGNIISQTTSRVLAQQVRLLAITNGYAPTTIVLKANRSDAFANAKVAWRTWWSIKNGKKTSQFSRNVLLTPVSSVLFTPYSGEVYNFEIADVNSYLANGVATHNCNHADGVKLLPDGRYVLDDHNSWNASWGPFGNGRVYIDEDHLFGGGDQADVCIIEAAIDDPNDTTNPPDYLP